MLIGRSGRSVVRNRRGALAERYDERRRFCEAGHDLVHDRFCIELMVSAIQTIYDEGARAVRPSEVAAAVSA